MKKSSVKIKRPVRREQIVEASLRVIAGGGVRALTTAAIAREAGISEANLYNHFKNKEDILIETVERIKKGLEDNVERALRPTTASPIKRLQRLFILHLDYIEKNAGIPRLVFSEEIHLGSAVLRERLLKTISSYAAKLETIVKEGQRTNIINPTMRPASIVAMFIGLVQIMAMRWSLSGFSFPLVREGEKLWNDFLSGITPRQ